jgi:hypothetical protein
MKRTGKRTILGGYKAYAFKEHDVVLDKLSRLYELAGVIGRNGQPDLKKVESKSGVTLGTLRNWNSRKVKRPQHAGVEAVVNGLGGSYEMMFGGKRILAGRIVSRNDVVAARVARKKARAGAKRKAA